VKYEDLYYLKRLVVKSDILDIPLCGGRKFALPAEAYKASSGTSLAEGASKQID